MSTFTVPLEIGSPDGQRWERIEAVVETGSTYSWVPRDVLSRLGIQPRVRREFETADQRVIERDLGIALSRTDGEELPALVVFVDPGGTPLLGAYTLEGFGLGADPVRGRLMPVRGLAMTSFYGAARTTEATLEVRAMLDPHPESVRRR